MRLLELFSGTGSVGQAFRATGWEVFSVDLDPKSPADLHQDVLEFDFCAFPAGHFDAVWASPPCTQYSVARTTGGPRDLEGADRLVRRTLEIICHLQPRAWWLENPWTGLMRKRPLMQGIPYHVVSYCMYGSPYRKHTALWTNVPAECLDLRVCDKTCGSYSMGRHAKSAQRGPARGNNPLTDRCSLDELHALPAALCRAIEEGTSLFLGGF